MATARMNESWLRMRSQIESLWSNYEFEDKELKKARGNLQRMVELIHEKTGEARSDIIQKISAFL